MQARIFARLIGNTRAAGKATVYRTGSLQSEYPCGISPPDNGVTSHGVMCRRVWPCHPGVWCEVSTRERYPDGSGPTAGAAAGWPLQRPALLPYRERSEAGGETEPVSCSALLGGDPWGDATLQVFPSRKDRGEPHRDFAVFARVPVVRRGNCCHAHAALAARAGEPEVQPVLELVCRECLGLPA